MMFHTKATRFTPSHLVLSCILALILGLVMVFFGTAVPAYAESPSVTVAHWDDDVGRKCVDYIMGTFDLDSYTRGTLPLEWFSSDPEEALKAGAALIRATGYHFYLNPEAPNPGSSLWCYDVPPNERDKFHLRTSTAAFDWCAAVPLSNVNNMPSDRVTETGGEVLTQNGGHPFYPWGACVQGDTVTLANQGRTYTYILTNSTYGVYGTENECESPLSGLAISTAYGFTPSMVNNTGPASFGSGYKTSTVTLVGDKRYAVAYWGFAHIDDISNGGSHYARGWHQGDKIEYLMKFGGTYSRLQMWVISDRPACVRVNIYVDGMFEAYRDWCHNDNVKHRQSKVIDGVSYGTHAIAFEFANDYYVYPPYDPDLDRNLFLNALRVDAE